MDDSPNAPATPAAVATLYPRESPGGPGNNGGNNNNNGGGGSGARSRASSAEAPQSEPSSPHPTKTAPWRTFDYETVAKSKRFNYLADPLMRRGYSLQHSHKDVFLSLFAVHNESMNIWSHLLGGLFFAFLLYVWTVDLNSPVLNDFLKGVHNSPPGLIMHFLSDRANEMRTDAQVAYKNAEHVFEELAKSSVLSAAEFAKQVAASVRDEPGKLAAYVMQLPVHLQDQAAAAMHAWVDAEQRLAATAETVMADASKMPDAFVRWLETAAKDNPQKLLVFVTSLPSNVDTESKRAAATVRAWLQAETRSIEELLARLQQPSNVSSWPLLCFIFGAVMCLTSSALYHWWVGYTKHAHDLMCRVDLGGISFMIWGSSTPLVYYVFYDEPAVRDAYLVVGTALCASTLVLAGLPVSVLHKIKKTRVVGYIGAGAFAVLPLFHAGAKWGWDSEEVQYYMNGGGIVIVGALYVLGAVVYVSRFPESRFPGRFDLLGASHQIWHLMVLLAACVHYVGVVQLFNWRVMRDAMDGANKTGEALCAGSAV